MINLEKKGVADWPFVKQLYEEGTSNADFQTSAPEWDECNSSHLSHVTSTARGKGSGKQLLQN